MGRGSHKKNYRDQEPKQQAELDERWRNRDRERNKERHTHIQEEKDRKICRHTERGEQRHKEAVFNI